MIFYFSNRMAQWFKLKTSSDRVHIDTLFEKAVRKTFRKLPENSIRVWQRFTKNPTNSIFTMCHCIYKKQKWKYRRINEVLVQNIQQHSFTQKRATCKCSNCSANVRDLVVFFIYYILLCGEVYWHYIISCYFFLIKCNSIQFYSTPWIHGNRICFVMNFHC